MVELPFLARARAFAGRIAFRTIEGRHTYQQLIDVSATVATTLLGSSADLDEARVALLVTPGFNYSAAQWAVWRAGGIAVPLCLSATLGEWEYALMDSQTGIVLADADNLARIQPVCERLGVRLLQLDTAANQARPTSALPDLHPLRRAMILYTSGTTSKPKGVVSTHANITAQITCLVQAWEWCEQDSIPLFLPLHHIHGIVNVVGCALWSGALVEPFARFDVTIVLERVRALAYTLFMAVPTIYVKLIQALEAVSPTDRADIVAGFSNMRLMISGSAALPASVHERWTALTGQRLLERYGMTEIGMAISNPYHGAAAPRRCRYAAASCRRAPQSRKRPGDNCGG